MFAADDNAAGSINYYQQELERFGKGADSVGASGAMTFSYPSPDAGRDRTARRTGRIGKPHQGRPDRHEQRRPAFFDYQNLAAVYPHYGNGLKQPRPVAGPAVAVTSVKPVSVDRYAVDGETTIESEASYAPQCSNCPHARTEWTRNDYGLTLSETAYRDYAAGANDRSKTETATTYGINTIYWMFLPQQTERRAYDSSGAWTPVGRTYYGYDGRSHDSLPSERGLLTSVETFRSPTQIAATATTYDNDGNAATVSDPNGHLTAFAYDARFHAYPVKEIAPPIGAMTFETSADYDALMRPWRATDANGKVTETQYDAFGRVTTVIAPGDSAAYPTVIYAYDQDGTAPEALRVTEKDGPETVTCVDGFGEVTQTKVKAVEYPADGIGAGIVRWRAIDRWQLVKDGKRLTMTSAPYFSTEAACDRAPSPEGSGKRLASTAAWFDPAAGHRTETTNFAGDAARVVSRHFTTISADEEGRKTTTAFSPAQGKTIVTDALGGITVTETFADLERITDAEQRVTTRALNWAGDALTLSDPDLGSRAYAYDLQGKLLSATDAKQQTIHYSYDAHDRLVLTDYPRDVGVDTQYFYDGDDNGDGRVERADMKGRRGRVTDASGSTEWMYDARGNVSNERKTIGTRVFLTRFRHNAYQLTGIEYPNGGWMLYRFDAGRETVSLSMTALRSRLIPSAAYSDWGRLMSLTCGNDVTTTYRYAPAAGNFRLTELAVTPASGPKLMQRRYAYNRVGDIVTLEDAVAATRQELRYDELDRLLSVTGASGDETFAYSPTGNLLRRNDAEYAYREGTHQVSRVTTGEQAAAYAYDANGSQRTRPGQRLTYDEEGRLVTVNGGYRRVFRFVYDYAGRRVKIIEPRRIIYTPNAYYEAEEALPSAALDSLTPMDSGALRMELGTLTINVAASLELGYGLGNFTVTMLIEGMRVTAVREGRTGTIYVGGDVRDRQTVPEGQITSLRVVIEELCTLPAPEITDAQSALRALSAEDAARLATDGLISQTIFFYLNGMRVAQARKSGKAAWVTTWIHSDHLQSATALTDKHGQAIRRLAYRAYGEETLNAGAGDAPRHTYTGKEHDGTGLLYYGARYYDPALARFITPDTVYDQGTQGLNRYSYALNNPFRYNDPTGHLSYADDQNPKLWPITLNHTPPSSSLTGIGDGILVNLHADEQIVPPPRVSIVEQATLRATPRRSVLRTNPLSRYLGDVLMLGTSIISPTSDWASCNAISRECYTPKEAFDAKFSTFVDLATAGVLKAGTVAQFPKANDFASPKLFQQHYKKHVVTGQEWGYTISEKSYLQRAQRFLSGPPNKNMLQYTRFDGDIVRFSTQTGEYGIVKPDGTIRTLFRPKPDASKGYTSGLEYFLQDRLKNIGY